MIAKKERVVSRLKRETNRFSREEEEVEESSSKSDGKGSREEV